MMENLNLKHPEAAADGQLPWRSAALTTHEGGPRLVTLYPSSLGAAMTQIHQVTIVYISVVMRVQTQTAPGPYHCYARAHEP